MCFYIGGEYKVTRYNDKFLPTPAEQRLIEQLVNPENMGKTITEICSKAGVVRDVYYDALKKEGFYEFLNKTIIECIKSRIGDVLNACFKYATNNAKNTADRRMLLEMAGMYKETKVVENKNTDNLNDYSEDDLKEALDKLKIIKMSKNGDNLTEQIPIQ